MEITTKKCAMKGLAFGAELESVKKLAMGQEKIDVYRRGFSQFVVQMGQHAKELEKCGIKDVQHLFDELMMGIFQNDVNRSSQAYNNLSSLHIEFS